MSGTTRRWRAPFPSLARKIYRTKDDAKADVFDYIECNPRRRRSTLGYLSPVQYEEQTMLA